MLDVFASASACYSSSTLLVLILLFSPYRRPRQPSPLSRRSPSRSLLFRHTAPPFPSPTASTTSSLKKFSTVRTLGALFLDLSFLMKLTSLWCASPKELSELPTPSSDVEAPLRLSSTSVPVRSSRYLPSSFLPLTSLSSKDHPCEAFRRLRLILLKNRHPRRVSARRPQSRTPSPSSDLRLPGIELATRRADDVRAVRRLYASRRRRRWALCVAFLPSPFLREQVD